jgi:hypothetical protein
MSRPTYISCACNAGGFCDCLERAQAAWDRRSIAQKNRRKMEFKTFESNNAANLFQQMANYFASHHKDLVPFHKIEVKDILWGTRKPKGSKYRFTAKVPVRKENY